MKIAVVLVACFGLALGASVPAPAAPSAVKDESTLLDDLMDFLLLLPIDDIVDVTMWYLENDQEVQGIIEWVQGEDFKALIILVNGIPAYIDFLDYLYFQGVDAYAYVNALHELLGIEPLVPPPRPMLRLDREPGYQGLVNAIIKLIPTEAVKELWRYKVANSPDFKKFVEMIESEKFETIVKAIYEAPEFQDVIKVLESKGINVQLVITYLKALFGWGG